MKNLIGFVVENSVVNIAPILLAALMSAFLIGPFLLNAGARSWVRGSTYSILGVLAGLLTYSYLDIPDRSIELEELVFISIGMFLLAMFFVIPSIILRSRFRSTKRSQKTS